MNWFQRKVKSLLIRSFSYSSTSGSIESDYRKMCTRKNIKGGAYCNYIFCILFPSLMLIITLYFTTKDKKSLSSWRHKRYLHMLHINDKHIDRLQCDIYTTRKEFSTNRKRRTDSFWTLTVKSSCHAKTLCYHNIIFISFSHFTFYFLSVFCLFSRSH